MSWWSRVNNVFRSDRLSGDLDEELEFHVAAPGPGTDRQRADARGGGAAGPPPGGQYPAPPRGEP